jgi:excisionase family DNA binding protein
MNPNSELVTVKELAKLWRSSPRTIYRLVEQGMPSIRLGPRIMRFDLEALNAWLQEHSA